jgi:hypothetical protein
MPDKITPIQQVREALEASINMDSPMECYPDECDNECPYMPDCVSKKILDALQILQGKVLVDRERLEEIILKLHSGNTFYPGSHHSNPHSVVKEIVTYLAKEDSNGHD